jgi:hypothetical protein
MDPATRCNPRAVDGFEEALARNGYGEIRMERIGGRRGGRIYGLFSLKPRGVR